MTIRELIERLECIAGVEGDAAQVYGTKWTTVGRMLSAPTPEVMFGAGDMATNDEAISERANGGTAVRVVVIS